MIRDIAGGGGGSANGVAFQAAANWVKIYVIDCDV
jgi:hypothetical protein